MSKILVIVLAVFVAALAASLPTAEEPTETTPGYCTYKGIKIKEGVYMPAPIGECSKVKCTNAEKRRLIKLTCPTFVPLPHCHLGQKDLTKPYPDCCPDEVCPDITQDKQEK